MIQGFLILTAEEPSNSMFTALKIQCIPKTTKGNLVLGGLMSFASLAMSELQALCYFMKPMVHAKRWDNPMVIKELDILFGPDDKKTQNFINNWCLKITQIALNAIVKTYQIKKKAFGNKFYWYCVHNNIDPVSVWPSPSSENLMKEENYDNYY
ncbi:uncharacterized protein CIMG_13184 [Coccidioides immitis RS]|uniref:Uncharacterized protein n=1 Tax=Coccidioides immitis (strain RS) TaxID=246410 RepID=A0A0D8JUF2_COCIM|nr:uncharacterized protein CIMG_13184 [Coccidioides immitis RS]KJF60744.1 hypothetical protein CIMG_13184 [Coccidioides immitis RS]